MKKEYTLEDLEKVLDSLPYKISLQNKVGKYIYVNNSLANKFEMKKEDILGKTPLDILGEEDCNIFNKSLTAIQDDSKGVFTEIKSKFNNKWCDLYRSKIHNNGKTLIISISNEVDNNMNRVYNNIYNMKEKASSNLLGSLDFLYDINDTLIFDTELKRRLTFLCEDIQHKVNADGISIYITNDTSNKLNLFVNSGDNIGLCESSKKTLYFLNNTIVVNKENLIKDCPKVVDFLINHIKIKTGKPHFIR